MANPVARITTITEVGYCPFCRRTRNLRREERQLGALVRTTIDCESCHRTLSSTIGPPAAKPEPEPEPEPEPVPEPAPAAEPTKPAAKKAARPRATASKPAAKAAPATKTPGRKKQTGS
jgi:hypothetical protein